MAYRLTGNAAAVEYFEKAVTLSASCAGQVGELLLNDDNAVVGFLSSTDRMEEVMVGSAKVSGIVDEDGVLHRISGSAVTIAGESLYTWKDNGYLQARNYAGKTARIYYAEDGTVSCVHLTSGGSKADTEVMVAETKTPANDGAS